MSIETTYSFDNANELTLNNAEIVSSKGQLGKVNNPGLLFEEDFNDDTDFTYDNTKATFTGARVENVDQTPSDAKIAATYSNVLDLSWSKDGSVAHTKVGSPELFNNKLRCPAGNNGVTYSNPAIASVGQAGAIKMMHTPQYSGSPATDNNIFELRNSSGGDADRIYLVHRADGTIRVSLWNSTGTSILSESTFSSWSPTSGTEYEFQLSWDTQSAFHLFIDGVRLGSSKSVSYTRGNQADQLRIGAGTTHNRAEADFDDVILFDAQQNTSAYSPGYTVRETIYQETKIDLPPFQYSGVGSIQSVDSATIIETGSPRYIIAGRYWDGTNWVISDGSYAQASPSSTVLTNLPSFPATGATTVPISTVFESSNQVQAVDDISVELTGQNFASSGSILTNNASTANDILSFAADFDDDDADVDIRFVLNVNGSNKYWDGSAWVGSDGSFSQANSIADVQANITDLLTINSDVKLLVVMQTADVTKTPTIDSATLNYTFGVIRPSVPNRCRVYGFLSDIEGNAVEGAEVTMALDRAKSQYKEAGLHLITDNLDLQTKTTDSQGFFEFNLIRSSEYETGSVEMKYKMSVKLSTDHQIKKIDSNGILFTVPDQSEINLTAQLAAS